MNTAEIVIGEVQGDSGFEMRQFLAERIREPRETAHCHSHGQVLSFHERRADMVGVRIARSNFGYNPRDARWGVPGIGSVELPVVAKHLRELREVRVQPKTQRHAFGVVVQPISSDLRPAFDAVVQIPKELSGIAAKTLSDVKRRDELGFSVNRYKHPLAPEFLRVTLADALLFLADPCPNFVNFQTPRFESAHSRIHKTGAAFSRHDEQAHDCVSIESGKPFRSANGAAFKK